jgi:hypothetical protein
MESILDQFTDNTKLETIPEETIEELNEDNLVKKPIKKRKSPIKKDSSNVDIEEKREQLCILQVLGTLEKYTGLQNKSLGDIKRLSTDDILKYHNRYQMTMGNKVTGSLVDLTIDSGVEIVSYALPIDNKEELKKDIKNNELVKQELTNAAGYVVLKGGRFVALASGLLQVIKHVDLKNIGKKEPIDDMDKYINDTVNNVLDNS